MKDYIVTITKSIKLILWLSGLNVFGLSLLHLEPWYHPPYKLLYDLGMTLLFYAFYALLYGLIRSLPSKDRILPLGVDRLCRDRGTN